MEIVNRDEILKYLNITLLSYSRICYFAPSKNPKHRIKARFLHVSPQVIQMRLNDVPENLDGALVFYSYTFIFRYHTHLQSGAEPGVYYCEIPQMIETFDRRKYARLKFESRENKIVTIHNQTLSSSIQGILTDISAGGIGFVVVNTERIPKAGDVIMTDIRLGDKKFQTLSKVAHVRNDQVGASFLEKSNKLQLELNAIIKTEINWRSETMLQNLKKREEIVKSFRKEQEKVDSRPRELDEKLDRLDPLIDLFVESFQVITGIGLNRETVEHKESTALSSLLSLHQDIHLADISLFQSYITASQDTLNHIAKPVFEDKLDGRAVNAGIILDQLGGRLEAFSKQLDKKKQILKFTGSDVVKTDKRFLSELLRKPSFKVGFSSSAGPFQLTLMAEDLEEALNLCDKAKEREFMTMDKMDLIEPISYSALKIFTDYLKLEVREKSVTFREQLLPRFEISVLLDIFFDDIDGKVILNMSKRLALKIFEKLFDEPVEEFNDEVKDAVAEITNMITGNAKAQFEEHGIYYKLATPVVVESREGVIIFATNMKFLSSVYWTSEGFFDLSFSFFKKR